jgi:ABC-type polysaccharide/polyol phosphate export permease
MGIGEVISLYRYRGFVWRRALTDVRHRFAGTGGGVLWNVLQPLASILLYAVVFTRLMSARLSGISGGFGYTLYLCSGILPWLAFNECVLRGTNALTANAQFLKKLAVPEYLFIAESAVSSGIGLIISFALLLVFSVAAGNPPTPYWTALPVPLFCFLWLGYALGVLGGSLRVFFPDVGQLLPLVLQIAMWAAPIVYSTEIPLPDFMRTVIAWHPITPALTAIRDLFLYARWPQSDSWLGMLAWPMALSIFAHAVLLKLRAEIRDVI